MDAHLKATALLERFKGIETLNPNINTLPHVNWNDAYFQQSFAAKVPRQRPPVANAQAAAKFFLDLYLGGPKKDTLKNAVWTLIYSTTLTNEDEYLVPEALINGIEIGGVAYQREADVVYAPLPEVVAMIGAHDYDGKHYTEADCKQWYRDIDQKLTEGDKNAINYVAYLAMTCIRLITKDIITVSKCIQASVNKNFANLWKKDPPTDRIPPPPSQPFNQTWTSVFLSGEGPIKDLVTLMIRIGITDSENSVCRIGIANATCLLNLRYTGMGCYACTMAAAAVLNVFPMVLIQHVLTKSTVVKLYLSISIFGLYICIE